MSPEEISKKLTELGEGLRFIDLFAAEKLTDKQQDLVHGLLELFQAMHWQFALDGHKRTEYMEVKPLLDHKCGTPVKVRSCKDGHGDKTYFGILLGDMALSISLSVDKEGTLRFGSSGYNPAIFVPELKTVIYGCESWWGEIKSEEELGKLITDDTIKNVWYVKALAKLGDKQADA